MTAATVGAVTASEVHPHVQRLIDCAPPLEGQRRTELTALLLQARAARNNSEAGPCPGPATATAEPAANATSAGDSCAG